MRLQSTTILESVIALLILVIVFMMVTNSIVSVSKSLNVGREIQLYNELKNKMYIVKSQNDFIDKEYVENGVFYTHKIMRLEENNNLISIKLTAKDSRLSSKVLNCEEIIPYKDL